MHQWMQHTGRSLAALEHEACEAYEAYEAALKAEMAADGLLQNVRVCLVTGQELPDSLVPLKTILGIETIYLPLAEPALTPIS